MYLKSLDIYGFKSFPGKISLKFDRGITIIVGPNGCGKSNIFDAIKWALGEQSPKSLRASKMEDVIFNGTESSPPLNYAEVTLVFSNEDGYLPIDYKEVAITRKLFRSGESEYYLNKTQVRLKDIEEIFMGTGFGEYTYSFVEQGKIEALLSYKPEEKRLIFDEASGIVRYKERKKETLRKLKDTEENILRLDDIISEVKRQIRYLERQVNKAKKYKELNDRLIVIEKKIAFIKIKAFNEELTALEEHIHQKEKIMREKEKELDEINKSTESIRREIDDIRNCIEDINSKVITANARIDSTEQHIRINEQRMKEIDERVKYIDKVIDELNLRLENNISRIEKEKELFNNLDGSYNNIDNQIISLQKRIQELNKFVEESRSKIENAKRSILEWEKKRVESNNALIEINIQIQSLIARRKRLELDKAKILMYLERHKERVNDADTQSAEIMKRIIAIREEKNTLNIEVKSLEKTIDSLDKNILDREKELVELNSYFEFLKELNIKYDQFPLNYQVTILFGKIPEKINTLIASLKDARINKEEINGRHIFKVETAAKILSLQDWELKERIDTLNSEISQFKEQLTQVKVEREKKLNQLLLINENILEEEKRYSEFAQEKENIQKECLRFQEETDIVEKELSQVVEEIHRLEEKQLSLEKEVEFAKNKIGEIENEMKSSEEAILSSLEEIKNLEIEITRKETEKESFYEQRGSFISKIAILEEEQNNLKERLAELANEKEDRLKRYSAFQLEIDDLKKNIDEDKKRIVEWGEDKKELTAKEQNLLALIDDKSKIISDLTQEIEKIKGEIYNERIRSQKIEFERDRVNDYLKQVYNIEFSPEDIVLEENDSLDILQQDRDVLKKKLESLGEVSLVAIEEFEELNKRYEFLENQKKDLLDSKENLKKAIYKINRTSKEIFLDTFKKIEDNFKQLFRFLFGGGRANLFLLDEENVLESGVDIEVQPPGKKLQNVSLLSGGEKALTAIALIFSIFKVKPSPLCVLDEIDAPLDEANVDRFNKLLKDFSKNTQYIIITHNKLTMSYADILYGVTMQEKGISKVVSVKFAET